MDKQPVGQLPDLASSNNDDEIMVITNDEYNQLKKEKISDFITDLQSTNENNALTKGTDGKMFVTDFGNASNITEGTLPVSVLPDIPKDLLPAIETTDLPASGVAANTYTYPSSVTVNAQGQVTAIEEGTPSGANANTDLSNITDAGKEVIKENSKSGTGLEIGDIGIAAFGIDESKGLRRYLNGSTLSVNQNTQAFVDKLKAAVLSYPSLACTETQWQAIAASSVGGQCGKFVIQDAEEINYFAYSSTVAEVTTTYFTKSTADAESVNVYNSSFEIQGQGSISSGVLTFNTATYSRDLEADTIQQITAYVRLPKIIMPIQGLTDLTKLGELVEAGLPNITGSVLRLAATTVMGAEGAFSFENNGNNNTNVGPSASMKINLDASRSNPIYGNSDTVQQEQIQYPYFIQIATGVEYEVNIVNDIELNNPYTLFDSKYTETQLYNTSWLLSNGNFYAKSVYVSAYEALVVENNSQVAAGTSVQLPSGTNYVKRGLSVKLSTDEDITDYDFVINTTNETFKLPLKTHLASGNTVVGNGLALGLTNGTTCYGLKAHLGGSYHYLQGIEELYGANIGTSDTIGSTMTNNLAMGVANDPTKSGIETSNSGLYLYFYVGETVQNANLINIGRFEENKANVNADNFSNIGKSNLFKFGMPSDYSIDLTLGASQQTVYTAPANGYVRFGKNVNSNSGQYIGIGVLKHGTATIESANLAYYEDNWSNVSGGSINITMPIAKSRKFYFGYSAGGATVCCKFIYAEGEEVTE